MDQIQNLRNSEIDKSKKMMKLLEDPIFNELIIEDFITQGIVSQTLNNRLDNTVTIDELKARQLLHKYLFGIITTGENISRK